MGRGRGSDRLPRLAGAGGKGGRLDLDATRRAGARPRGRPGRAHPSPHGSGGRGELSPRLLVVPSGGHTVVGSSKCVDAGIRKWIQGGTPSGRCPRIPLTIDPLRPTLPAVDDADPAGRKVGLVGRTLGATIATLRSAEAAWLTSYPAGWVVGLEGGLLAGENFDVFRFSAYSDIPGLAISGRLSFSVSDAGLVPGSESGIVQVGGSRAASGFLQVQRHRIFGILGGKRVSARF